MSDTTIIERICRNCQCVESWHSAIDGACPEDADAPHPDAEADDDDA